MSQFDYLRRHEIIEYLVEKYGQERVSQIGTYTSLSTKAVLKDIGRGLNIDHTIITEINKHVPVVFGKPYPISKCLEEVSTIQEYAEQYPELFEMALKVEGMPRSSSVHACGLLIAPSSISTSVPVMRGKEGEMVSQYDGPTLEEFGFLKFDLLGLKNLSVVAIARDLVEQRHGVSLDPDKFDPTDDGVYATIGNGRTLGIFQIESSGMSGVFKGLDTVNFESLIAGLSLYRPGPMDYIPEYQARANGMRDVSYFHPDAESVLSKTFGIMIYQEQLMQLAGVFGGYSEGEQDTLRKATGKKSQKVMDKVLPELHLRTLQNGYDEKTADQLVELIKPFVGYGFNRSHAAAYALLTYQTAYFKTYYPAEFFTALLSVFSDDEAKVTAYIQDAKSYDIQILPPDVNNSKLGFSIENNDIRFGLEAIKGFGAVAINNVLEARPFMDLEDMTGRVPKKGLNKAALKALALSGALDTMVSDHFNRYEILQQVYLLRGYDEDLTSEIDHFNNKVKLETEKHYLSVYLSGHPLDGIGVPVDWANIPDNEKVISSGMVADIREILTKKGDPMAFIKIDFLEGQHDMVCFPMTYADIRGIIKKDMLVKVECNFKYNPQRDDRSLILDKITIPKRVNKHLFES